MANQYDIIVIGGGPGGYVAAIRAEHLGGICLNWGCIPTKALLRSAEIYHYMEHAKDYGLSAEKIGFDAAAVVKRSRGVSERLSTGVGFLMKKNKIDVIWGEAKLDAPGKVVVAAATKSLLVIGSGAIGIEFASFYRTMGAEVTVVEVLPQILPVEDAEIAALARKRFEKQGMQILTGAKVTGIEKGADGVTATVDDGKGVQTLTAERLISAVGGGGEGEKF